MSDPYVAPPGSLEGLRRLNRIRVLDEVQRRGGTTRVDLVRTTGLSRSTVSSLVADLLDAGVLVEHADVPARPSTPAGGRPPTLLTVNPTSGTLVGAHFAHDGARVAIADLAGTIIDEATLAIDVDHRADESLRWATSTARRLVDALDRAWSTVVGMGVAVSTPLPGLDRPMTADSLLPDWQGRDVAGELGDSLGIPVHVENDANLGAVAEWTFGAGRGIDDLVYLMLSDGVGAGIVTDGRLHRGSGGAAGEVGHTVCVPDGALCRCGNRGCLETVAGGPALVRAAQQFDNSVLTLDDAVGLALSGHAGAVEVITDAGTAVGEVVAAICRLLDPRIVVLGGKIAAIGDPLLEAVRTGLRRRMPPDADMVEVALGTLGNRAEVLGAIALAGRSAPSRLLELGRSPTA